MPACSRLSRSVVTTAEEQHNHREKWTEGNKEICACMVPNTIRRIKFCGKLDSSKLHLCNQAHQCCSLLRMLVRYKNTIQRVYQEPNPKFAFYTWSICFGLCKTVLFVFGVFNSFAFPFCTSMISLPLTQLAKCACWKLGVIIRSRPGR